MKKYRHIVNLGLFLAQIVPTIYLIYYLVINLGRPDVEIILNFIFICGLAITLFKNKNAFTLALGLTIIIGNFAGLTAFVTLTKQGFFFNIGQLPIPLYWGQPFYSLLLIIYIIFNRGFYTGIATQKYWTDFLTREEDLEVVYSIVEADDKASEDNNSSGHLSEN